MVAGLLLAGTCRLSAQAPGTKDTSFTAVETGNSYYTQLLEYIGGTPVLFIGGDQDAINEFLVSGTDLVGGSVAGTDFTGFGDEGIGPDFGNVARIIYTAVPELPKPGVATPQILVGGQFGRSETQVTNNTPGQNILRLTPTASIDKTFNVDPNSKKPGKGANDFVTAILPLADGGMVVGGQFDQFNGQDHLHLVRLDGTGNIVSAAVFDPNLSFDATVLSLDAQQVAGARNGQILVAGQFSNVDGKTYNKLVRLNADGSVDASFHPSFDDRTVIVKSQPDGKILVGGDFENVNGTTANHIVRLNFDGSIDPSFTAQVTVMPAGFANPPAVNVIQLLDNGSMYLGGNFAAVDGVTRNYLALVDSTGALDPSFDPGTTIINAVQSLVVQTDGRLLVGETLSRALPGGKIYPPSLIRLFGGPTAVTLTAPKPNASEGNGTNPSTIRHGSFVLRRGGDSVSTSGPLTVYLQLSGDASASTKTARGDYARLELTKINKKEGLYSATFPTGVNSIKFKVIPSGLPIQFASGKRTITLTVLPDPRDAAMYNPDSSATVTITND